MVTMTLTEFNQRRSTALRQADNEDVLIERGGVPAYRLSRIAAHPRTVAAEVEAGRMTSPTREAPGRARRVCRVDVDLVEASITEREAGR